MKITICDKCGSIIEIELNGNTSTIGYVDYQLCEKCQQDIKGNMLTNRLDRTKLEKAIKEICNEKH